MCVNERNFVSVILRNVCESVLAYKFVIRYTLMLETDYGKDVEVKLLWGCEDEKREGEKDQKERNGRVGAEIQFSGLGFVHRVFVAVVLSFVFFGGVRKNGCGGGIPLQCDII